MWRAALIGLVACGRPAPAAKPAAPDGDRGSAADRRLSVVDHRAFDETSLTADLALERISSAYMAEIQRCYKELLVQDATARGKLGLDFTVDETGHVRMPKATGFSTTLDACIEARMTAWEFPIPKEADGEPTEAVFKITLQLVPE